MKVLSPLFDWRAQIAQSDLPAGSKHVALTLSLHMSAIGSSCFPTISKLATETSKSRAAVVAAIQQLEDDGWLEVVHGGGRGKPNRYTATIGLTVSQRTVSPERVSLESLNGQPGELEDVIEDVDHPSGGTPGSPQALVATFADLVTKSGVTPSKTLRARMGRAVKELLEEGIPYEQVEAGVERLVEKNLLQPSLLAAMSVEAMLARRMPPVAGPKVTGWRLVRGSHGTTHIPDPQGTDRPPVGWQA